MTKHLFTLLVLITVSLPLSGCGGEEAAPKKAVVDVKTTKPSATQTAAKSAAAKAVAAATGNVDKAAPGTPTPAAAAQNSPAAAAKSGKDAQKAAPETKPAAPKTDGGAPKPAAEAPKPTDDKKVATNSEPEEPLSPLTVPKGYRYEPRGRRDPFVNPIPKPTAAAAEAPVARPDGLPGVMVNELKVSGIIYARDPAMKKAILAAGRKTYFAKQGDHLFDAVIKEIRPSEVVFTMVSTASRKPLNRETIVSTGGPSSGRR